MTEITLRANGQNRKVAVDDPNMPLLYALRDDLGLRGPKFGCGLGQCGACSVIIDGEVVRSCVSLAIDAHDKDITTLEGLGDSDNPSKVQAAFIAEQAAQCGYCTNGMIMTATALLSRRPRPTESDIRDALAGNLCRCGSHARVVAAILRAAREG
jgi:nicotinate dehydrogenase subunit A